MEWQTQATPLRKLEDGGIEAEPPNDGSWEPIGATETHVVWRRRVFKAEDTKNDRAMRELYAELLEHASEENAELKTALVELDGHAAELEKKAAGNDELAAKLARAREEANLENKRSYAKGYAAGQKTAAAASTRAAEAPTLPVEPKASTDASPQATSGYKAGYRAGTKYGERNGRLATLAKLEPLLEFLSRGEPGSKNTAAAIAALEQLRQARAADLEGAQESEPALKAGEVEDRKGEA